MGCCAPTYLGTAQTLGEAFERTENGCLSGRQWSSTIFLRKPTVEAVLARYQQRSSEGASDLPDERAINIAGYAFLPHRRFDEAIALFRFNVAAYPQSWNAFDSLSEAYEMAGKKQLAIENARKSLELNPGNDASAQRIERLKQ